MKAILGAILGITITFSPLVAGQEPAPEKEKQKQDEAKKPPTKQQEPQTPEKPKPKPEKPAQPPAPPKPQKPGPEDKQQQQDKQQQKENQEEAKKAQQSKPPGQSGQQNNAKQETARASYGKGQRIPTEKFQSSFGSQHHFRVQHLENGRRFESGGYRFELVEVWPAGWSYDDDCYIEQDGDDYYVVDLYHPDIRVAVIVVEG
jgi:outer membrane biosynthesis protein TonB